MFHHAVHDCVSSCSSQCFIMQFTKVLHCVVYHCCDIVHYMSVFRHAVYDSVSSCSLSLEAQQYSKEVLDVKSQLEASVIKIEGNTTAL